MRSVSVCPTSSLILIGCDRLTLSKIKKSHPSELHLCQIWWRLDKMFGCEAFSENPKWWKIQCSGNLRQWVCWTRLDPWNPTVPNFCIRLKTFVYKRTSKFDPLVALETWILVKIIMRLSSIIFEDFKSFYHTVLGASLARRRWWIIIRRRNTLCADAASLLGPQ